jgi:ppGpp synthetase/RelA/SpoT-type nucleotidyltranferase
LEHKLERKAIEAKKRGISFDIDPDNLFERIQDLAGVRLLHLHTEQMTAINPAVLAVFEELNYEVEEGPIANLWDEEYKAYFESIDIETQMRPDTMYTSVHYIVRANTRTLIFCELQIRTLSEELWGEVSHSINYPDPTTSIACKEQLKVLARATSTCTRLVDSIIKSHREHDERGLS